VSYVFWNIFWCLVGAALLGGLIGWLLKQFLGGNRIAELEAGWQSKLGGIEGERDRLALASREADDKLTSWRTKYSGLETEYGTIKTDLTKLTAGLKVCGDARAGLEAQLAKNAAVIADLENRLQLAIAGDKAGDAAYEKQIAELKAQLAVAGQHHTELESGWTTRFTALESDRNLFRAQLTDLSARAGKADAGYQVQIAGYAAEIADLKAQMAAASRERTELESSWTARFAGFEKAGAEHQTQSAAYAEEIADLKRQLALSEKRLDKAVAGDKADDAAYQKQIADLKAQLAGTQQSLSKAVAGDKADDAAYEKQIVELKAQLAAAAKQRAELESSWTARLAGFEKTGADHQAQIVELKTQMAGTEQRLAKAVASDKADATANEKRIAELQARIEKLIATDKANDAGYEKQLADLRAQLTASQTETNKAASQAASMVAAADHDALKAKLADAEARAKKIVAGDIERIEGIGTVYGQKLRANGIAWVRELLAHGANPDGRTGIATATGIKPELILAWVNAADLLRVDGITPDWAELLEVSGVDTVKELRNRVPANLLAKMTETNPSGPNGRFAPTLPELSEVESWIGQAKGMQPRVTH
jgi:chromosome segregation ATPase